MKVAAESLDELDGEVGIVMVVDRTDDFLFPNRPLRAGVALGPRWGSGWREDSLVEVGDGVAGGEG